MNTNHTILNTIADFLSKLFNQKILYKFFPQQEDNIKIKTTFSKIDFAYYLSKNNKIDFQNWLNQNLLTSKLSNQNIYISDFPKLSLQDPLVKIALKELIQFKKQQLNKISSLTKKDVNLNNLLDIVIHEPQKSKSLILSSFNTYNKNLFTQVPPILPSMDYELFSENIKYNKVEQVHPKLKNIIIEKQNEGYLYSNENGFNKQFILKLTLVYEFNIVENNEIQEMIKSYTIIGNHIEDLDYETTDYWDFKPQNIFEIPNLEDEINQNTQFVFHNKNSEINFNMYNNSVKFQQLRFTNNGIWIDDIIFLKNIAIVPI